ncbi:serine/threonine-protein kinase [Nocardia asteroides]|uniref:serine/threonine-protein kinase n=1 Tax=Nocardia asteroides TaxID=1824 RepID=UPI001E2F56B1|nr:serine/threonine-protein kinase [Nocardia asteroides]UGT53903.1 serine/threonine protein kinase [Nocardia asteroides]
MSGTLSPGTVFAGYRIERVLGAGGMGTVYVATHPRLPRRDALKVLPENAGAGSEFHARFLREAELSARLDHPNIVSVYDRGIEDGRLWIAMELVDGTDVAALLRRESALPPERAVHIVTETARGLDEAHRNGLLHRDVKPANILLEPVDDAPERVLVADFGIARAAGDGTALTAVGTVVATLAYAAPELLTEQRVDHRADVYALGCTLFEMLTGAKPFPRDSVVAVMQAHLMVPPPRATAIRPELPPAIDAVLARAMAKNPEDRFSSCGALAAATAAAFGVAVEQTVVASPPPIPPAADVTVAPPSAPTIVHRTPRRTHRSLRYAAAAVAVVAVVAATTVAVVLARDRGEPAASTAAPTTAAGVTWGRYSFIVDALPRLLPATPTRTGHQGIRCAAIARGADGVTRQADLDVLPEPIARITCTGDENPVRDVYVECSTNRSPYTLVDEPGVVILGDHTWNRASGRGRITWSTLALTNGDIGTIGISFDEPTRNFCMVVVSGGKTGQDLYDRWWPNAPF